MQPGRQSAGFLNAARGTATIMADIAALELPGAPDEAPLNRFHRRAVLVSGMTFFTDAYDLFVIGIVSTLLKEQWNWTRASSRCSTRPCSVPPSSVRSCSDGSPT
jgi:hypothetical protein